MTIDEVGNVAAFLLLRPRERDHRRDHLRRLRLLDRRGRPARTDARPRSRAARCRCARALRRRRHRRRPQRPRLRRVPRRGRAVGLRARAPRRRRRRRGHRGVPPGLPQLDRELHGQPARSARSSATSTSREHGLADRRAAVRELPAAVAARGRLPEGRRRARRDAGRGREVLAPRRRRAARRTTRCSTASPTCCATCCWPRRRRWSVRTRGVAGAARRVEGRAPLPRARPRRAARRARPVHQERGRRARPLVRVGADQGGVRLRRGRRQLREPLHAGLGLRAAAPRVRRGERQARGSGATRSAAWARSRRRWRSECAARGVDAAHRRAGRARDRQGAAAPRASSSTAARWSRRRRVVANVNPKLLFERLVAPEHLDRRTSARASPAYRCGSGTFRMNVALSELPDFTALPGTRGAAASRAAASSSRRRSRTWSARTSTRGRAAGRARRSSRC